MGPKRSAILRTRLTASDASFTFASRSVGHVCGLFRSASNKRLPSSEYTAPLDTTQVPGVGRVLMSIFLGTGCLLRRLQRQHLARNTPFATVLVCAVDFSADEFCDLVVFPVR